MSGRDFGGEMRLRLADGTNLTMRGGFTVSTAGVSIEVVTNTDGSVSRQATPKPRTAEVTLEDSDFDTDALLRAARQDVYIVEDFTNITHVFISAVFSGTDSSDRQTGELSGLVINASGYQRING